jgi:hypothetical protein
VAHPALAILGVVQIQRGYVPQGLAALRRAVETDAPAGWPERADAEADLGLAYLLSGDEAAGLRWLHTAQHRFAAAGDDEALMYCLSNEARYLVHTGKQAEATALQERMRALEMQ